MTILCTLVYLIAGALHGVCDLDVTKPAPQDTAIMSSASDGGHSGADKAMVADHHCHGCFSVSVAVPAVTSAPTVFVRAIPTVGQPDHVGATPRLDTPPPKHLT